MDKLKEIFNYFIEMIKKILRLIGILKDETTAAIPEDNSAA